MHYFLTHLLFLMYGAFAGAALWALITRDNGAAARDAVWDHPDLLPGTLDLDDPAGYAARRATAVDDAAEVDRALAEILGEDPDADPTP